MAFGHSLLAMSGEESLAQVNREIEHPKLKNLKRAAIVIAIYSLIFTGGATLLASMLIPSEGSRPLPGQPDRRPGHVHGGPHVLAHRLPHLCGAGRLPDSLRSHQHLDDRLDRRADARGRRRRADRLVPQAASQVRHQLSHRQPGLHPADGHHHRQPRQCHHPGRGVCLRRDLVVHLQQPGHAGAALEVPRRTRLEGSAQYPHRQDGDPHRADLRFPGPAFHGHCEPVHQVHRHGQRHHLCRGLLHHLHRLRAAEPAQARDYRAADEGSLPARTPGHDQPRVGGHSAGRRDGDHARRRQPAGAEVDACRIPAPKTRMLW